MVNVGIDIKDIPKIADKEFSVTLNAFFVVRWKDERLVIDQVNFQTFHFFKTDSIKSCSFSINRDFLFLHILLWILE